MQEETGRTWCTQEKFMTKLRPEKTHRGWVDIPIEPNSLERGNRLAWAGGGPDTKVSKGRGLGS